MRLGWEQTEPPAEKGEERVVTCPLGLVFQACTGMGHGQKDIRGIGTRGDCWGTARLGGRRGQPGHHCSRAAGEYGYSLSSEITPR